MGPDSYRAAGIVDAIRSLGHVVEDRGNLQQPKGRDLQHPNSAISALGETAAWVTELSCAAWDASADQQFPIFMGGDHSLALGTVPGVSRYSRELGKPQFVLWLDAHPDIHDLNSTSSGNLHGTPVAYFTGQPGFEGWFEAVEQPVLPENVCMMGIRSVDTAENERLSGFGSVVHDMRYIDEHGIVAPLRQFLERVQRADGRLHVSLDVDFLDPNIAPAVGTTVPGGATFREAHLIMEMLCDSGLVTSLDLVELNPFLDERGRTAKLMVDLCASLLGRKVLDRPTTSF